MKNRVMAGVLALAVSMMGVSTAGAFNLFGSDDSQPRRQERSAVVMAQAGDAEMRVQQLEEQLRQLNGRVEEMSFQLLQMQEQLRKAQEDNEFRFQELEGGGKKKSSIEVVPGAGDVNTANASGAQSPGANDTLDSADQQPMDSASTEDPGIGAPPADLGTIEFDQNGNPMTPANPTPPAVDTSELPPPATPSSPDTGNFTGDEGQYQAAYNRILAGDYAGAEAGFAEFIANHPDSKRIADANFWLGEAQYSQEKYTDSAKTFLNAYKSHGSSGKAPEMLLKLAMSLAALDSKDTACATLREVTKSYPKASRAVISKVASEQKRLACG
ncbi:tol-pal system protein YbgF [Rhizobium sp. SG_E_25_P2]|uniref:tol-pal system protein YbgF n=1 Tax=Rhizobium sp. SG_E_25_P2 TaxID=2879942 RepID=UPI0024744B7E|nr:tol-pal system protein YbgF [Rhizobium sp. SG_E_25_P2]MDH6265736.1 tol-pal system protein YbgF [Rhizobium sp. SG_E_25_P2]